MAPLIAFGSAVIASPDVMFFEEPGLTTPLSGWTNWWTCRWLARSNAPQVS